MKALLALLLSLLIVLLSAVGGFAAPQFPWTKFSDMVGSSTGSALGLCPTSDGELHETVTAWFEDKQGHRWSFTYDTETAMIVVFYFGEGDRATEFARAKVNLDRHDDVPSLSFRPLPNHIQHSCQLLEEDKQA